MQFTGDILLITTTTYDVRTLLYTYFSTNETLYNKRIK